MTDFTTHMIDQVKAANADHQTIAVLGNNTKSHLGRHIQCDHTLSLSEHRGILIHNPEELYITARAGTPVAEIQQALAEKNQTLAFDPPLLDGKATIGGTIAANLSGPGRPWLGAGRDMLLGISLINGLGEHLSFGGQVMKNVAGYDVSRLQAGALGTLGIMSELSLKVVPKAEVSKTCQFDLPIEQAVTKMNQLASLPLPFSGMMWLNGLLYIRLSGEANAVTAATQRVGGILCEGSLWEGVREQTHPFFGGTSKKWRFSLASDARPQLTEAPWLIEWGGAQRWLRGDSDQQRLIQIANEGQGSVTLTKGNSSNEDPFQQPPAALKALLQKVKLSFDPNSVLNPGRLYDWM